MDAGLMESLSAEAQRQAGAEPGHDGEGESGSEAGGGAVFVSGIFYSQLVCSHIPGAGSPASVETGKTWLFLPVLLYLCAHGLLWLALGYVGRLPERVAFSLHLVMLGACGGLFTCFCEKEEDRCVWLRPAVGLLCLLSLGTVLFQWQGAKTGNQEKLAMDGSFQTFKNACKEDTDHLYFIETYMAEPGGRSPCDGEWQFQPEPLPDPGRLVYGFAAGSGALCSSWH